MPSNVIYLIYSRKRISILLLQLSRFRAVVSRGAGHPRNLGVLLTLFQPEGADYAHPIIASTLGFQNLTTALLNVKNVPIYPGFNSHF